MIEARVIAREDPCPCASGNTWGACCGVLSTAPIHAFARVTNNPTHHFFAVDATSGAPLCDGSGAVYVWTNRALAMQIGEARRRGRNAVAVIGMGDEKWALFQAEVRHVLVEGSA